MRVGVGALVESRSPKNGSGYRPLFEEELEGCVSLHGMAHKEMRDSAMHLARLLHNSDQRDEAGALAAKYGVSLQTGDWAQSTNVSG